MSFVNLTAGIGGLLSFFINDRLGRLWTLRLYMAIYMAGVLIETFSSGIIGVLYLGRLVAGLGIGSLTVIGPMAIVEIAPKATRGLSEPLSKCLAMLLANVWPYSDSLVQRLHDRLADGWHFRRLWREREHLLEQDVAVSSTLLRPAFRPYDRHLSFAFHVRISSLAILARKEGRGVCDTGQSPWTWTGPRSPAVRMVAAQSPTRCRASGIWQADRLWHHQGDFHEAEQSSSCPAHSYGLPVGSALRRELSHQLPAADLRFRGCEV